MGIGMIGTTTTTITTTSPITIITTTITTISIGLLECIILLLSEIWMTFLNHNLFTIVTIVTTTTTAIAITAGTTFVDTIGWSRM